MKFKFYTVSSFIILILLINSIFPNIIYAHGPFPGLAMIIIGFIMGIPTLIILTILLILSIVFRKKSIKRKKGLIFGKIAVIISIILPIIYFIISYSYDVDWIYKDSDFPILIAILWFPIIILGSITIYFNVKLIKSLN